MCLIEAIYKNREAANYQISLLFNSTIEIPEEILGRLSKLTKKPDIIKVDLGLPKEPRTDFSIAPLIKNNQEILSKELTNRYDSEKINFLILALYLDEVCPVFPGKKIASNNMLVYYDSIPLLYHQRYGQFKGFFDNFYLPHTASVFQADKIFTISKTVANDLHIMLGIVKDKIVNIDGASIPLKQNKKPNIVIDGDFILMPSGQELRKNNNRALRAFEEFRLQHDKELKLVLTSFFTDEAKEELGALSNNLVFTGNVDEADLAELYKNCRLVFFASEYEGLGLPILEGVAVNKAIACSAISVFKEMSKEAFTYFDPLNIESIADGLHRANEKALRGDLNNKEYESILNKYTWGNTAKKLVKSIPTIESTDVIKKRVAIFCPDPEGFSAIGKVVAESHSAYSEYFEIDYYFDRGPNHKYMRPNFVKYTTNCYEAEDFKVRDSEKYEAIIYHIGNSEYHLNIIRIALAVPGYTIFHDTNLGGAYDSLLENGYISKKRFQLEKELDAKTGKENLKTKSSFLTSVANNQKGILVHSKYAEAAIKNKIFESVQIKKADLPVGVPIYPEIAKINNDTLTISFAGIIAKVKGTSVIEQIALSREFSGYKIQIFGFSAVEPDEIARLRTLPHVQIYTNPTDFEFQQLMASTDILINVRLEYKGETSLTTLEQMRYGGVVILRDFGWYAELPKDSVVAVKEPLDTIGQLSKLLIEKGNISQTGHRAIEYISSHHTHELYAQKMHELINSIQT